MKKSMLYSTGVDCAGTIFLPFENETPSQLYAEETEIQRPSLRRAPITVCEEGWVATPDKGKTLLSKSSYDVPIGSPNVLLIFAFFYMCYKSYLRHKRAAILILFLCLSPLNSLHANITALRLNAEAFTAGSDIRIEPTIASVPEGEVYICWSLFHDAGCSQEVEDLRFRSDAGFGKNAVRCTAPEAAGTYYLRASIHTEGGCMGSIDSYIVSPLIVYPEDADIVFRRDAQSPATVHLFHESESMRAYAAVRISRATLDNPGLSEYERYNYWISFPFDIQLSDIHGFGTIGEDWRICYYDGLGRAQEGYFAERTTNWVAFADTDSVLHAGQGYLLQFNPVQIASHGDGLWTNGDVGTLYFPALSRISEIMSSDVTIAGLPESYRCTIDLSDQLGSEGDRRNKDSYWRCIGIPGWGVPSSLDGVSYLYEWDSSDNSLEVVPAEGYAFAPGHAYLIQNGDAFTWRGLIIPRSASEEPWREGATYSQYRIEVSEKESVHDQTYIRLSNEAWVTAGFDLGRDLSKEWNSGRANIYTLIEEEYAAANCIPDDDQKIIIPLGLTIPVAGIYRIAIGEASQEDKLTSYESRKRGTVLVDRESNRRTTLSGEEGYTVFLEKGRHDDRFYIEIPPASVLPTETRVTVAEERGMKVWMNGGLYILRGADVYTLQGFKIK
jgi:hypothetical protein